MNGKAFWWKLRRWSKPKENVWPTRKPEPAGDNARHYSGRSWTTTMSSALAFAYASFFLDALPAERQR